MRAQPNNATQSSFGEPPFDSLLMRRHWIPKRVPHHQLHLPHVAVNSEQKSRIVCGLPVIKWVRVNRNEECNGFESGEEVGVLYKKELLAIAKFHEETRQLLPRRVFPVSDR